MVKTQRRQPRGFGKSYTQKQFNEQEFIRADLESQQLFELWTYTVGIANTARTLTTEQAVNSWNEYWIVAVAKLGQLNIADPKHFYWLPRIKGTILFAMNEMVNTFDRSALEELSLRTRTKHGLLAETTLELGLAFKHENVIYAGESITVYKGKDDSIGKGELMIAVKHASGCWSHYPSPENARISLSDYKKAKSALSKYPTALKGELTHSQSGKLAKLLGLTVNGGYAYLIK